MSPHVIRRLAFLILTTFGLFAATTARSGPYDNWQQLGPGAGGQIYSFAFDPGSPSTVFCGTDVAGLFLSSDSGGAWTYLNAGTHVGYAQDVFIDPRNSNRIFVSMADGIYVSPDRGASWSRYGNPVTEGTQVYFGDIDGAYNASDQLVLYVGTGNFRNGLQYNYISYRSPSDPDNPVITYSTPQVFRSVETSSGVAWSSSAPPMPDAVKYAVYSVKVNPANTDDVYVSTGDGLFKTVDGGATWTDEASALSTRKFRKLINNPANFDDLIVTAVDTPPLTDPPTPASGHLYSRASGSSTWVEHTGNLNSISGVGAAGELNALEWDSSTAWGDGLYAGTFNAKNGLLSTSVGTSASPTWTAVAKNPSSVGDFGWNDDKGPTAKMQTFGRDPNGNFWLGTSGNFFKCASLSGTIHWYQQYTTEVSSVAAAHDTRANGYAWQDNYWTHTGYLNCVPRGVFIDDRKPNEIWVTCADRVVFHSVDRGLSWRQLKFYIQAHDDSGALKNYVCGDAFKVAFDPKDTTANTIYISAAAGFGKNEGIGGLFRSTDGGACWTLIGGGESGLGGLPGLEIWDMSIHDSSTSDNMYVAARDGGIYRSTNRDGASPTWTCVGLANDFLCRVVVDPVNSNFVWAGCRDGATNWTLYGKPDHGEIGLWKGTKSGTSWCWKHVLNTDECWDIKFDPNNVNNMYVALGKSGLYSSSDRGATWSAALLPSPVGPGGIHAVCVDKQTSDVYTDYDGRFTQKPAMMRLTAGTGTWTDITGTNPQAFGASINVISDTDGHKYIYADSSGLFVSKLDITSVP